MSTRGDRPVERPPLLRLVPWVVSLLVLAGVGALAVQAGPRPAPSVAPLPTITPPPEGSGDLYVSPSGVDGAGGDRSSPLRTIKAAADRATPGVTIWLAAGAYDGFTVSSSGTTGSPITIAGMAGVTATIEPAGRDATIDLSAAHDITLLNLTIEGPHGQALDAIRMEHSARIVVAGSKIENSVSGFGIEVRYSAEVTISGNEIAHNGVGIRLYGEDDPASVHDVLIEHNAIHDSDSMIVNDAAPDNDFGANAIIWHKVTGTTIARDNQIWSNRAASHDYGTDGGAFEIWGSSNMEITGNTAWDNVNVLETGSDGPACSNISFTRNTAFTTNRGVGLILRCASDSLFAHNVLDRVEDYAFELSDRSGGNHFANSIAGLRIVDNIVVGTPLYVIRNDLPASVTLDYNLAWETGGALAQLPGHGTISSLADLTRISGYEVHGVMADPRFVDGAAHDYRLVAGSAALDRGIPIAPGEAFLGPAPDIGRYEGPTALPSGS
jgi:parallel beta-helix repeat protein